MLPEARAVPAGTPRAAVSGTGPSSSEADAGILGIARRIRYEVGANRKAAPAGATWSFLLPHLPLGRVAIVGEPGPAARERLAELADEVLDGLPDRGTVDLIWLTPSASPPGATGAGGADPAVGTSLAEGGLIVDERPAGETDRTAHSVRFRVLRRGGDTIVAVPLGHTVVEAWLRSHGLAGLERNGIPGRLRRLRSVLSGRTRTTTATEGTLDLVGQNGLDRPALYIRELAASAGIVIDDHVMALSATGPYRTQKVLLPLFPPGASAPAIIVKATRHPSVNPRLQVELDGLRWLGTMGPTITERVPAVRFSGLHAGMLVVGEGVLEGRPFRAPRANDHPLAADAVDWLTELAVRTVDRVDAEAVATGLSELVDSYVTAEGPGRALSDPLRLQVDRIRRSRASFPVVAQHGDPGTWNLIALPGERTGFLDWENFERRGMPLWDLFYLLRSLGVGTRARRPLERRLGHVQRTLLDESELTPFIVDSVRRYCAQVGLAEDLVEPLYHLGWMYQALKEVTRLRPGHLDKGHFYQLLRRGLERRDRGTLQRLFEGET